MLTLFGRHKLTLNVCKINSDAMLSSTFCFCVCQSFIININMVRGKNKQPLRKPRTAISKVAPGGPCFCGWWNVEDRMAQTSRAGGRRSMPNYVLVRQLRLCLHFQLEPAHILGDTPAASCQTDRDIFKQFSFGFFFEFFFKWKI